MLLEQIQNDLKQAMLGRDEVTTSTLRMVVAAAANARIAQGADLTDQDITTLMQKEAKQRDEAITNARQAGREDLVGKNEQEKAVLAKYLPVQMSEDAIRQVVTETITELGASSKADLGKVMAAAMGKLRGQADGAVVSRIAGEALS